MKKFLGEFKEFINRGCIFEREGVAALVLPRFTG